MNIKLLEHGKNKAELGELMEAVYRGCVEWIVNMAARNALPGVGEGGGLTERGYEQVSKKVNSELENLMIYRGGR